MPADGNVQAPGIEPVHVPAVVPDVLGAAPALTVPERALSGSQGRDGWSGRLRQSE